MRRYLKSKLHTGLLPPRLHCLMSIKSSRNVLQKKMNLNQIRIRPAKSVSSDCGCGVCTRSFRMDPSVHIHRIPRLLHLFFFFAFHYSFYFRFSTVEMLSLSLLHLPCPVLRCMVGRWAVDWPSLDVAAPPDPGCGESIFGAITCALYWRCSTGRLGSCFLSLSFLFLRNADQFQQ